MEDTSSKVKRTESSYFAFFDLDRTITGAISGKELARGAFRKGIMNFPDLIRGIFLSVTFRLGLKNQNDIIYDLVKWVKGMPEQTLSDLCTDISEKILIPSVFKDARSEIKYHLENNGKVVILSSALKCVCSKMANDLNIGDFICSELEVKKGILTGRSRGPLCFGKEKLVRFLEYCWKNNVSIEDSWYYADSISDLNVMAVTGHPVCINPDRKLKKAARANKWAIRKWK
jgi:HAD superfamily hydrolase (TIGR01490 family)